MLFESQWLWTAVSRPRLMLLMWLVSMFLLQTKLITYKVSSHPSPSTQFLTDPVTMSRKQTPTIMRGQELRQQEPNTRRADSPGRIFSILGLRCPGLAPDQDMVTAQVTPATWTTEEVIGRSTLTRQFYQKTNLWITGQGHAPRSICLIQYRWDAGEMQEISLKILSNISCLSLKSSKWGCMSLQTHF